VGDALAQGGSTAYKLPTAPTGIATI
jgi:hypothetical protein